MSALTLTPLPSRHLDVVEPPEPQPLAVAPTATLLILDDCPEDRAVYRRYLLEDRYQHYRILEADSAEQGWEQLRQTPCDLILLDLRLPDLDGLEFLEQLRIHHQTLPVIMLTAYGDEAIAVQALKGGVQDYLIKHHLKRDVLQLAVRTVLCQSRLQARLEKNLDRQRLIAAIALRIRQSLDLKQILHTAVMEVRHWLQCDRVLVHQFVSDGEATLVAESRHPNLPRSSQLGIDSIPRQTPESPDLPSCDLVNPGSNLVIPITLTQPQSSLADLSPSRLPPSHLSPSHSSLSHSSLSHSSLSHSSPSQASPSYVWGVLVADQQSVPRQWQSDEVEILKELAVQLAIAIQQAELFAKTQAALDKEKELNTFRSQIISTISHEYQSPLAAILAAASTLKSHSKTLSFSMQQRCLSIIEQKTRHLSALVQDMLIMNQAEQVGAAFKPIALDLAQLLADLIEEQRLATPDPPEICFQTPGNLPVFWGDRDILRQIFVNLLSNSIKYSPEKGPITVELQDEGTHLRCQIQDQGMGIPLEDLPHLFRSFSRGSNVGTIPGTGLGLAIAHSCVKLHQGEITLDSHLDRGTRVTVRLPKISPP